MHNKFSERFICPICKSRLSLAPFVSDKERVIDGVFTCVNEGHQYPLLGRIPRLLRYDLLFSVVDVVSLREYILRYKKFLSPSLFDLFYHYTENSNHTRSAKTANYYAYMWQHYNTCFDRLDRHELFRLLGTEFNHSEFRGKSVIDIGAGQGRFVFPLIDAGALEVTCLDLGQAIELTETKLRNLDSVLCIQADIFDLPLVSSYDVVMCIGVLQHLTEPSLGFEKLVSLANPGGRILSWCYGLSSVRHLLQVLRLFSTKMPIGMIWNVAAIIATIRRAIGWIGNNLRNHGLARIADLVPFGIYHEYDFHYLRTNTFDHLSAQIIHFFTRHEVESWLRNPRIQQALLTERHPGTSGSSWVIDARLNEQYV